MSLDRELLHDLFGRIGVDWEILHATLEASGEAYAATLGAAALLAYLGLFTVMRRIVFTGAALAQLAAAGVGAAFFVNGITALPMAVRQAAGTWGPFAGSMLFSLLGAFGMQARPHRHRSSPDALVGLVFVGAAAASILLVWKSPNGLNDLRNVLSGQVLLSSGEQFFPLWFGIVAVGVLHFVYRRQFLLCSYDAEFARVLGLPERRYQLFLLGSVAIAVALALNAMGLILVFAFLVVPPLAGLAMGRRLGDSTRLAMASAMAGTMLGFGLASHFELPPSQTVAVSLIALLALAKVGAMAAPLRWLVAGLFYILALLALVLAAAIFPWPSPDDVMAGGGHGHGGHSATASEGGPSVQDQIQQALVELSGGTDVTTREKAAKTIAELRYPDAGLIEPLLKATDPMTEDEAVRREVDLALRGILDVAPQALARLKRLAADKDLDTASLASRTLLRLGHVEGHRFLIECLAHPDLPPFGVEDWLELLTAASGGRDFGFDPDAEAEANAEAIEKWRSWWRDEGSKGGLSYDASQGRFQPRDG
jgi:ABC-type Mn2+/Zn2+ transport system permease subunit